MVIYNCGITSQKPRRKAFAVYVLLKKKSRVFFSFKEKDWSNEAGFLRKNCGLVLLVLYRLLTRTTIFTVTGQILMKIPIGLITKNPKESDGAEKTAVFYFLSKSKPRRTQRFRLPVQMGVGAGAKFLLETHLPH